MKTFRVNFLRPERARVAMMKKNNNTFYGSKWVEMFNCTGETPSSSGTYSSFFSLTLTKMLPPT